MSHTAARGGVTREGAISSTGNIAQRWVVAETACCVRSRSSPGRAVVALVVLPNGCTTYLRAWMLTHLFILVKSQRTEWETLPKQI